MTKLQKDANGLFPGEARHGIPDFLRRVIVIDPVLRQRAINRVEDPQASAQNWVPPWASTSPSRDA
jgi:hypothetical protein